MNTSTKINLGSLGGLLVGLLVMNGYVTPASAPQVAQEIDAFTGAAITIISVVAWFAHHLNQGKKEPLVVVSHPVTEEPVVEAQQPV